MRGGGGGAVCRACECEDPEFRFRVLGFGFRVHVTGFRNLVPRFQGLGFRCPHFKISGLGAQVSGFWD